MLPCLHSFCKPCLSKYIEEKKKSTDNKMACPTCYNSFPLPEDINSFPVNLHLSHLARSRVIEKQVEEGNVKCQVCDDKVTSFCCHCCEFLCGKCKLCHLHYLGKEHKILELASYKKKSLEFVFLLQNVLSIPNKSLIFSAMSVKSLSVLTVLRKITRIIRKDLLMKCLKKKRMSFKN